MLQKLKNFWNNPYSAPLTDPLRNVGSTVAKAVSGYTEAVREAFDDSYIPYNQQGKSRAGRIYKNILDRHDGFELLNGIGVVLGGLAAGGGAGVVAFNGVAGGIAAKVAAAAVSGIAGGALGVVAAPVVLAVGIAAGAVVVGTVLGVVPGVIGGAAKAIKHHKGLKNPAPATPPVPAQQQGQSQTLSRIVADFTQLDGQGQRKVLERLEMHANLTPQEKIFGAVEKLSEAQRIALIEALEQKLGSAFDAVARKKAAEAGVLDEDISVQPISTKLKRRNTAPAGGAAG